MTERPTPGVAACGRDDARLSGYIDGALSQGDAQRVRLHLEDCAACRTLVEDMTRNRRAAITTRFTIPSDDQWNETPRGGLSRISRNLGWAILALWLVVALTLLLWQPVGMSSKVLVRILVGGSLAGVGALFVSALLDRMQAMKADIYRGVEK